MTDIWFNYLNELVEQRIKEPPPPTGIGPAQIASEKRDFDVLGKLNLDKIYDHKVNQSLQEISLQ